MLETFRYLTGVLEQEERKELRKWIVLNSISGFIDILNFGLTIYFIIAIPKRYTVTGMIQESIVMFVLFVVVTEAVFVINSFFMLYQYKLSNRIIFCGAHKLSVKIYELFVKENLEYHNQKNVEQAIEMVRSDTKECVSIVITCVEIVRNIIILICYVLMMILSFKWTGILGCILILLFIGGLFRWQRIQMKNYGEKSRMYNIKANVQISTTYGAFEEIAISNKVDLAIQRYRDFSEAFSVAQNESGLKANVVSTIMIFSIRVIKYVIFSILVISADKLVSILVPMTMYIAALDKMTPVSNSILNGMGKLEFCRKPYEELKKNLVRFEELKEKEKEINLLRQKRLTFQKGLTVRNLSFAYNEQTRIFEDASMEIPTGKSVAVIGVSGIGKTTLLALLIGLLRPQCGNILYDDYDIVTQTDAEGACRASLGEIISYIPQTVYMNGETVCHNVAFLENPDEINEKRVIECLKCAQIWEDVSKMPEGIHTRISERGTTISGGQRQRIALARALYRDFELLIMDEATAALDMEMEKAVIDSIRQVRQDKTLLIVTHHMSLANECEIIYKIDKKKITRVK